MILEFDGRDRKWENDVIWANEDGYHDVEDCNSARMSILVRRSFNKLTDWSFVGMRRRNNISFEEDFEEDAFTDLRRKLVDHLSYKFFNRRNDLEWLN